MNLQLKINDINFLNWLIKQIKKLIITSFDYKKCQLIEEYINIIFKSLGYPNVDINKLILISTQYLICNDYGVYKVIHINPTIFYNKTNYRLVDLCKLINFGTIGLDGYPIYSEVFNYVSSNIDEFYKIYLREKGVMI